MRRFTPILLIIGFLLVLGVQPSQADWIINVLTGKLDYYEPAGAPLAHAATHAGGGADPVDHDTLLNYVAGQHLVLPGTIVATLTDHDLAAHTGLGLAITAHAMSTHADDDTYNISTSGSAAIGVGLGSGNPKFSISGWDAFASVLDTYPISAAMDAGAGTKLAIGLDETMRTMVICEAGDVDSDFSLVASADPVVSIRGATTSQYLSLKQDAITSSGTLTISYYNDLKFTARSDLAAGNMLTFNSGSGDELTDTNAEQAFMYIEPKISQTSTAGYVGLLMDVTETSTGSGDNELMALRVATADKFTVSNTGLATAGVGYNYAAETTATPNAAFTVDWTVKHVQRVTITGVNLDVTFTDPAGPCRLVLVVVQGDGDDTIDWTNEASILWPGGVDPTLSTTNAYVDVITFYYNSGVYYGVANYDFR